MSVHEHLTVCERHGVTVIRLLDHRLDDEVDLDSLWRKVSQLIESEGRKHFVLDFSLVAFLGSSALGKLITAHKKVRGVNGMLKLCCICPQVHEVFSMTKLDSLFRIEDTEASAIAAFE